MKVAVSLASTQKDAQRMPLFCSSRKHKRRRTGPVTTSGLFVVIGAILFALGLIPVMDVNAQNRATPVVETGFLFTLGSPEGELSEYLDDQVFGFHAFVGGRRSMASPLLLGTELGIELYGSNQLYDTGDGTGNGTPVNINTYNNIGSGHLFIRLQPVGGFARPYVETLAGLKVFFATTVVSYPESEYDDSGSTTIALDSAAFSYGVGGGISLNLLGVIVPDNPGTVFFTIGARYLMGAEATYLIPPGERESEINQSETHLLETRFGLEIRFQ